MAGKNLHKLFIQDLVQVPMMIQLGYWPDLDKHPVCKSINNNLKILLIEQRDWMKLLWSAVSSPDSGTMFGWAYKCFDQWLWRQPPVLHAIAGTLAPQTMRVKGTVCWQAVVLLIDSGSTHDFSNPSMAKKAGLPIRESRSMEVMVAIGYKLSSLGFCKQVLLSVCTDFYLLKLEGCDVALGAR